jgi:hypothetical protein
MHSTPRLRLDRHWTEGRERYPRCCSRVRHCRRSRSPHIHSGLAHEQSMRKRGMTTIGPTFREERISEHFHVYGPSLPDLAFSYNIAHVACADRSRVSKTLRPLSISRQTARMFSNVRRSSRNDFLWIQLHRRATLLNHLWHWECFQVIEGEKHNEQRQQQHRYSEPAR